MENMDPEKATQINFLRGKLRSLTADIKSILEQGRLVSSDSTQLFLFKGMYVGLKPIFDKFNETWDKLVEMYAAEGLSVSFPEENDKKLQKQAKQAYYEACAIYEAHMNPTPTAHNISNGSLEDTQAPLPQRSLPQFSGAQADWPAFREACQSLVQKKPSLSNIQKFNFLISSLSGPALSLITTDPLLDTTYERAWKILTDNYDEKRRLASNYIRNAFNYSQMRRRPTVAGLKHFISTVLESLGAYQKLDLPNSENFIITNYALWCLDIQTKKEFEKEMAQEKNPTFNQLFDFIKRKLKSMETTGDESQSSSIPHDGTSQVNSQPAGSELSNSHPANASSDRNTQPDSKKSSKFRNSNLSCYLCKRRHTLQNCHRFRGAPNAKKLSLLKDWPGCLNCLSDRHTIDSCGSIKTCIKCSQKHHSWLHASWPANGLPKQDTAQLNCELEQKTENGDIDTDQSPPSISTDHSPTTVSKDDSWGEGFTEQIAIDVSTEENTAALSTDQSPAAAAKT